MKRFFYLGMLVAVGFLWSGCRENAVGPVMAGAGSPLVVDTLSKRGMFGGGDTLSGSRDVDPVLPAPQREPDAAARNGVVNEAAEQTNIR